MTSGKPNDRMSLNTSEVSQIGFAKASEVCLVNLELPGKRFICSDVFGDVSKVLGGFFVSSVTVNHPKGPPGRTFEDKAWPYFH